LTVGDVASVFKHPVVFAEDVVQIVDGAVAYSVVKVVQASDLVEPFFRVYPVKAV